MNHNQMSLTIKTMIKTSVVLKMTLCILMVTTTLASAQSLEIEAVPYAVSARNQESVFQAINNAAKRDQANKLVIGWTDFFWKETTIHATNNQEGCSVDDLSMNAKIVSNYPKIANADSKEWELRFYAFSESVKKHELRHAQIYQAHWDMLQRHLKTYSGKVFKNKSCDEVQGDLVDMLQNWFLNTKQDQADLDKQEGHVSAKDIQEFLIR